ncbi:hypothetical protein ACQFX9_04635 [Aliinostoc sp. HNIBRCY26]|uniref:hypothetical protein n=1 Tax=Aliinostoc sp. HNIBRCY26 TaxID=3418997 RepID=UPI003D01DD87
MVRHTESENNKPIIHPLAIARVNMYRMLYSTEHRTETGKRLNWDWGLGTGDWGLGNRKN